MVFRLGRITEFFQEKVGWPDDERRECNQQECQPGPAGHPCLCGSFAEAINVIHIHGGEWVGEFGSGRGQEEIAEQHRGPSQSGPSPRGAAVIAELGDEEQQQERQPAVKE